MVNGNGIAVGGVQGVVQADDQSEDARRLKLEMDKAEVVILWKDDRGVNSVLEKFVDMYHGSSLLQVEGGFAADRVLAYLQGEYVLFDEIDEKPGSAFTASRLCKIKKWANDQGAKVCFSTNSLQTVALIDDCDLAFKLIRSDGRDIRDYDIVSARSATRALRERLVSLEQSNVLVLYKDYPGATDIFRHFADVCDRAVLSTIQDCLSSNIHLSKWYALFDEVPGSVFTEDALREIGNWINADRERRVCISTTSARTLRLLENAGISYTSVHAVGASFVEVTKSVGLMYQEFHHNRVLVLTGRNGSGKSRAFRAFADTNDCTLIVDSQILDESGLSGRNILRRQIASFQERELGKFVKAACRIKSGDLSNIDFETREIYSDLRLNSVGVWCGNEERLRAWLPQNNELVRVRLLGRQPSNYLYFFLIESSPSMRFDRGGSVDFVRLGDANLLAGFNALVKDVGLAWTVVFNQGPSPEVTGLYVEKDSSTRILARDLSSGELSIFNAIALYFCLKKEDRAHRPKYVLFDEADRQLDPVLKKVFCNLLKKWADTPGMPKVAIITHHVDTVNLLDSLGVGATFLNLENGAMKSITATHAAFKLMPNIPALNDRRYRVYVEAHHDQRSYAVFYSAMLRLQEKRNNKVEIAELNSNGDKAPRPFLEYLKRRTLSRRYLLDFVSAAVQRDGSNGGWKQVLMHVSTVFSVYKRKGYEAAFGIIDGDYGEGNGHVNEEFTREAERSLVHVLGRHSVESYLYDPAMAWLCRSELRAKINVRLGNRRLSDEVRERVQRLQVLLSSTDVKFDPFCMKYKVIVLEEILSQSSTGSEPDERTLLAFMISQTAFCAFGIEDLRLMQAEELYRILQRSYGESQITQLASKLVEAGMFEQVRGHNLADAVANLTGIGPGGVNSRGWLDIVEQELEQRPDAVHEDLKEVFFSLNEKARKYGNYLAKPPGGAGRGNG